MVRKIISGGQTGADRAALDIALKFSIDHGGWVPRGRKSEDGRVPEIYRMAEMPAGGYPERTEKNVRAAQATVIFSHGPLSGGARLTWRLARALSKPCCHLDLLQMDEFEAAICLQGFLADHAIEVLNIAGPRASQDPAIYWSVRGVLETILFMETMDDPPEPMVFVDTLLLERRCETACATVADAVAFIAAGLHLRTRSVIANLPRREIAAGYFALADTLKVKLGLDSVNRPLLAACAREAGQRTILPEDAAMVIFKALKSRLEQDHVLRVVP